MPRPRHTALALVGMPAAAAPPEFDAESVVQPMIARLEQWSSDEVPVMNGVETLALTGAEARCLVAYVRWLEADRDVLGDALIAERRGRPPRGARR